MNRLENDITTLKGVGEKRAKLYQKLGINTLNDLINHFPRTYIDFTQPVPIKDAIIGENNVISGIVTKRLPISRIRKGMTIYKAVVTDGETDITIIIYNSEFLYDKLKLNQSFVLYGKVNGNFLRREMTSPLILPEVNDDKIQPVYHLTEGLNQSMYGATVKNALQVFDANIYEPLPKWVLQEYNLCTLEYAMKNYHFPSSIEAMKNAKRRLVFDELLTLQLGMLMLRSRNNKKLGCAMQDIDTTDFEKSLPFEMTNAQKKSIKECLFDMMRENPMNRLVQGDVGSGKTAVAAACCYVAHKNNCQSALMAPTEILATQHFKTLSDFLNPLGIKVCLLTGSLTAKQKRDIKQDIENGTYSVVIGTHALFSQSTIFKNLSLVITDEQHRFGVEQRATLIAKGDNPHCLVMSATPIPRTLAMMVYGDLDISILDELPKGRQPIETYAVTGKLRERAFGFIEKQINEGRQAYIVCPAIDETENELQSVTTYTQKLSQTVLGKFKIGMLHGKLSATEKDSIMQDFKDNKLQLLVCTTVVEVGVDVPNAVAILIENAERFGLSQLHQLRGRVGRGEYKSHCILVTDNKNEESVQRLKVLCSTNDGFKISEADLKLRGPGDFFGKRQHGLPALNIADMSDDITVLNQVQILAKRIIDKDPELKDVENKHLAKLITKLYSNTD